MAWEKKGGGGRPVPQTGVEWGIIYEVDFTVQTPVASFNPGGPYLIDRKPWWLKGTLVQGGGVVQSSSLNASGLNITANFSSEGTPAATNLRWFARISELTDRYNPRAPLAIWFRGSNTAPVDDVNTNTIVGFCNGAESSASLTAAERLTRVSGAVRPNATTTQITWWVADTTGGAAHTAAVGGSNEKIAVQLLDSGVEYNVKPWAPPGETDPYLTTNTVAAANRWRDLVNARTLPTLGIFFTVNFNGGSTQTFSVQNLQILQPVNQ